MFACACLVWKDAAVRWEQLFADLEGQFEAAAEEDLQLEVADRTRRELARIAMRDRLRASVGSTVTVEVGGSSTTGRLAAVGADWLLVRPDHRALLVVLAAVSGLVGLQASAVEPDSVPAVESRLGLGHALRAIARDRAAVTLMRRDGTTLTGTIDRVGADHLELAEHGLDEFPRPDRLRGRRTVPFAAVAAVRSD